MNIEAIHNGGQHWNRFQMIEQSSIELVLRDRPWLKRENLFDFEDLFYEIWSRQQMKGDEEKCESI
jgi:hypothetical protein